MLGANSNESLEANVSRLAYDEQGGSGLVEVRGINSEGGKEEGEQEQYGDGSTGEGRERLAAVAATAAAAITGISPLPPAPRYGKHEAWSSIDKERRRGIVRRGRVTGGIVKKEEVNLPTKLIVQQPSAEMLDVPNSVVVGKECSPLHLSPKHLAARRSNRGVLSGTGRKEDNTVVAREKKLPSLNISADMTEVQIN